MEKNYAMPRVADTARSRLSRPDERSTSLSLRNKLGVPQTYLDTGCVVFAHALQIHIIGHLVVKAVDVQFQLFGKLGFGAQVLGWA